MLIIVRSRILVLMFDEVDLEGFESILRDERWVMINDHINDMTLYTR